MALKANKETPAESRLTRRARFHHRRRSASMAAAWPISARAESFPSRHGSSLIVPFAAGGPTDVLARILAAHMQTTLGQTVVIENVTGASGTLAGMRAARATPDGYTITIGHWATHVLNGAIYQLQYDVLRDFEPVVLLANGPQLIIGRPTLPAQDLKELTAWLKDNPNKATAGTAGAGDRRPCRRGFLPDHDRNQLFLCALSRRRPRAQRPDGRTYRYDVRSGNRISLPQVRGGKVKAYAVTSALAAGVRTRYPDRG